MVFAFSYLLGKSSETMLDFAPEYNEPVAALYAAKHCVQLRASWRRASKQSPITPHSASHEGARVGATVGAAVGVRLEYCSSVLGMNVGNAVGDLVVGC